MTENLHIRIFLQFLFKSTVGNGLHTTHTSEDELSMEYRIHLPHPVPMLYAIAEMLQIPRHIHKSLREHQLFSPALVDVRVNSK